MSALAAPLVSFSLSLSTVGVLPRSRVLAWHGETLYAASGYTLLAAKMTARTTPQWQEVASFRPAIVRSITSHSNLTSRLVRDGFHALAVHPSGNLIAAVPGAIITCPAGSRSFRISHRISRGSRPLHICSTPQGALYFGEYFDNAGRDAVHIFASHDAGATWQAAYTFPAGIIRHVHNIVYDKWHACLWILTGDNAEECQILRASLDLRDISIELSGSQQTRAAALIPTPDGVLFSTDTPFEQNCVYRLVPGRTPQRIFDLPSSSIYGCAVGNSLFFSTMVEPSATNLEPRTCLFGSPDGFTWQSLLRMQKDRWPIRYFQYPNIFLPDGINDSRFLALSTVAVEDHDMQTMIFRMHR